MNLTLDISPRLIPSVVSIYTDINRVFMEYIDNSIDNSEQFFDRESNSYSRPIEIKIWFQGSTYRDSILKIEDNCAGMEDISKITSSLGDSDKASNSLLNGQFGFGVYSFMAVCNTLKITSKVSNNQTIKSIELKSDIFDKSKTEDVSLGGVLETQTRSQNSFTVVSLSDFIKDKFKEISIDELKKEIEKHFEVILSRSNIKITITNSSNDTEECKPFDYSLFTGPEYIKEIRELKYTYSKKYSSLRTMSIADSPVKIYLKLTIDKAIDRKPFFVIKGRRIADISDIKAFRTYSKGLIWSHPNVTGYIDVTGCLEPTIARNEVRNTNKSKALFQTLLRYEEEIKRFVEENLNHVTSSQYNRLESILNRAVNDLSKESEVNKRNVLQEGQNNNLDTESRDGIETTKKYVIVNRQDTDSTDETSEDTDPDEPSEETDPDDPSEDTNTNTPSEETDLSKQTIEIPVKAKRRRRRNNDSENTDSCGLNILIDHEQDPMKDKQNMPLRSVLYESKIVIYKKHPEFMRRLDVTIHGIPKISSSLITYLCSEILVHYKSLKKLQGDASMDKKILFNDFLESLYCLENKLSCLKNKKLSDFS